MRFEGPAFQGKQKDYQGPAIVVQWVEVEGPIYGSWPPASHERLWAGVPLEPILGVKPNEDPNAHLDHPPTDIARPRLTRLPQSKEDKETGNRYVYDPKQGVGGELLYKRTRVKDSLHPTRRLAPQNPKQDAARLLSSFVASAYRYPVTEQDVAPFLQLVTRWLDEGVTFEKAMRAGYKAILTSPGFLYHQGTLHDEPVKQRLTPHELAERMAFFLWNSSPDKELLDFANSGALADPDSLRAQVERMLIDRKSNRFIESFLGQWLDLRLIDFTAPDSDLYPEFNDLLQYSMVGRDQGLLSRTPR